MLELEFSEPHYALMAVSWRFYQYEAPEGACKAGGGIRDVLLRGLVWEFCLFFSCFCGLLCFATPINVTWAPLLTWQQQLVLEAVGSGFQFISSFPEGASSSSQRYQYHTAGHCPLLRSQSYSSTLAHSESSENIPGWQWASTWPCGHSGSCSPVTQPLPGKPVFRGKLSTCPHTWRTRVRRIVGDESEEGCGGFYRPEPRAVSLTSALSPGPV